MSYVLKYNFGTDYNIYLFKLCLSLKRLLRSAESFNSILFVPDKFTFLNKVEILGILQSV